MTDHRRASNQLEYETKTTFVVVITWISKHGSKNSNKWTIIKLN